MFNEDQVLNQKAIEVNSHHILPIDKELAEKMQEGYQNALEKELQSELKRRGLDRWGRLYTISRLIIEEIEGILKPFKEYSKLRSKLEDLQKNVKMYIDITESFKPEEVIGGPPEPNKLLLVIRDQQSLDAYNFLLAGYIKYTEYLIRNTEELKQEIDKFVKELPIDIAKFKQEIENLPDSLILRIDREQLIKLLDFISLESQGIKHANISQSLSIMIKNVTTAYEITEYSSAAKLPEK